MRINYCKIFFGRCFRNWWYVTLFGACIEFNRSCGYTCALYFIYILSCIDKEGWFSWVCNCFHIIIQMVQIYHLFYVLSFSISNLDRRWMGKFLVGPEENHDNILEIIISSWICSMYYILPLLFFCVHCDLKYAAGEIFLTFG